MSMLPSKMIRSTPALSRNIWPLSKSKAYSTEATFETKPYKLHRLESGPSTTVTCNKEDALHMYRQMQAIRRLETSASNLYKEKAVRGFCHLYSGQEACAVGMRKAMSDVDTIITAYRTFGNCDQVPLGAGLGFAHKYKGDGGINISLYGDGAANQGQIFEAYNMAKLWNLPCIFVCENNGYGMGTSAERASANVNYYTRGDTVPGIWVDGMDVLAVREATRFAKQMCTDGQGPVLMETATYRYSGHSMSDPGTSYRTREEIQEVRQSRDPITSFKDKIINAGLTTAEELKSIDNEVRVEVDKATKDAKADGEISLEEIAADIYALNLEGPVRGIVSGDSFKHINIGPQVNRK
ncbi:putative pyruvate dehydrogenase E1 component subunit alpha, mitochondrial [Orchesella cincta]|uniref:Putative pyruvate dehydrogenase E1 component subunit alpha, mitochondrial n=1 Tax=Orchesella cincta TaxID=48709 RepID=A0A1D2MA58_ORCCI|nr:putative pyruvate dehydrogenase E1 component subunit alpha, mitochondrial [Orchesella cincta]